jgi:hypothetical protein
MAEKVVTTEKKTVRTKHSVDGMRPQAKRQQANPTIDLRDEAKTESSTKNKAEKFAEKYGLAIVLMGTMAVAGYIGYKYLDNEKSLDTITPIEESCPSTSFEMPGVERGESEFGDWKLDGIEIPADADPTEVYNGWIDSVVDEDPANLLGYAKMVNGFYMNHDNVTQADKDFKALLDKIAVEDLTYKSNTLHCASNQAVDIVEYIKSKKVDISIIENVSEIPGVTIYNTYIKDSVVVENHNSGIDLEGRNALIISYLDEDGNEVDKVGTAGICGNPFTLVPPVYHPPVYIPTKPPVYHPPVYVPRPKLEEKDPSDDVGVNKKVADWKQDDTDGRASRGHKVEPKNDDGEYEDDGYKNPIGLQEDPKEDAKEAEKKAEKVTEKLEDTHEEAQEEAVVVDNNQSHEESEPLPANW